MKQTGYQKTVIKIVILLAVVCIQSARGSDLPRGLIVHIGGTPPEAGQGHVLHQLPQAAARLRYAENTVRHPPREITARVN